MQLKNLNRELLVTQFNFKLNSYLRKSVKYKIFKGKPFFEI